MEKAVRTRGATTTTTPLETDGKVVWSGEFQKLPQTPFQLLTPSPVHHRPEFLLSPFTLTAASYPHSRPSPSLQHQAFSVAPNPPCPLTLTAVAFSMEERAISFDISAFRWRLRKTKSPRRFGVERWRLVYQFFFHWVHSGFLIQTRRSQPPRTAGHFSWGYVHIHLVF